MTKEQELFGYRMPPKKELEKTIKRLLEFPQKQKQPIATAEEPFLLKWDEFGKELIKKSHELFDMPAVKIWGTKEEYEDNEERSVCIIERLALITTIYKNPQLRSANLWPITLLQSEQLLKQGKLPEPKNYREDLAFFLYDIDGPQKDEAISLKESIKKYRTSFGLSKSDLEEGLLIVNAGVEKDGDYFYGVKPIILPGLTQVYLHETLEKRGDYTFKYGLKHGLPPAKELGKGDRKLHLVPKKEEVLGLRVLGRGKDLNLGVRFEGLDVSDPEFKVCFARQKK